MQTLPEPSQQTEPGSPARVNWWDIVWYILAGYGLFQLAGIGVVAVIVGAGAPAYLLTAAMALLNFIFLGGTAYFLGVRRGRFTWDEIGLRPARWSWKWAGLAGLLAVALLPLRGCLGFVVLLLSGQDLSSLAERQNLILPEYNLPTFLVSLIGVGLLAPFAEELFFRGAIYTWFRKRFGFGLAVMASSTMFAMAHIDNVGVAASSLVMGIVNAWLMERTRSLWAPFVAHAVTNSLAILLAFGIMALETWLPTPKLS